MIMNKLHGLVLIALLFFVGCAHRKIQKQKEESPLILLYQELLAKESMLPDVPLDADIHHIFTDYLQPEHIEIVYATKLSSDEITTIYIQEMERLGWNKIMQSNLKSSMLVFQSPVFVCTVSIDPCGDEYKVTVIKKYRG